MNHTRRFAAGVGTTNAGIMFGGNSIVSCQEEYNGTSWSTTVALTTNRSDLGGSGTANNAIAAGGSPTTVSCTEEYNGISWVAGCTINNARGGGGASGNADSALYYGGYISPAASFCTEEYYQPQTVSAGHITTFTYSPTDGDIEITGSFDIDLNRVNETTGTFSIQGLPSDTTSTEYLAIDSNGIVGKGAGNFSGATLAGPIYRSVDTVLIINDTASFDFSKNDNFVLNAGQDYKFDWVVTSDNVGQSGTIVINNTATATPDTLPSITKTPDGASILFVTASNTTSVLSYYVAATDKILVNYIGNFA